MIAGDSDYIENRLNRESAKEGSPMGREYQRDELPMRAVPKDGDAIA